MKGAKLDMTYADRWLLPDGVEDILPAKAARLEAIRRRLLDLYSRWGYEQVIPPLLEYTDSLLSGVGRDLDLMTFKVTDQLSGRTMGVRADMTPQISRIDAHSFKREGVSRLCYSGHVLQTKAKSALATRSPIQAGVEIYGEASTGADVEVISLLLASLKASGLSQLNIDLGHVGIYRAVAEFAQLDTSEEQEFFDLLQGKAITEINGWVAANISDARAAKMLRALPNLAGNRDALVRAREVLADAPESVQLALNELDQVATAVSERFPKAQLYFDLGELRGYNYHTGIVFAAFAPGYGSAIANGGRYDGVAQGDRPATGFAVDITAVEGLVDVALPTSGAIFTSASNRADQWDAINELRAAGEVVICGFDGQTVAEVAASSSVGGDRQLVLDAERFVVKPL